MLVYFDEFCGGLLMWLWRRFFFFAMGRGLVVCGGYC